MTHYTGLNPKSLTRLLEQSKTGREHRHFGTSAMRSQDLGF